MVIDRRSPEARKWRKLYKKARWQQIRAIQLQTEPLCAICFAAGRFTTATVCDHIEPHRGDTDKFWNGPFQSLCDEAPWRCHSSKKQSDERLGFSKAVGSDGWPTDPRHIANRTVAMSWARHRWGFSIPDGLQPSAIPVTLVCGAPASGKSTYVSERAKRGDTIIDFDECLLKVGGKRWDDDAITQRKAFAYRDQIILGLKDKHSGHAWLIVSAPTQDERATWAEALTHTTIVVLNTTLQDCLSRIGASPERAHAAHRLSLVARRWFASASAREM